MSKSKIDSKEKQPWFECYMKERGLKIGDNYSSIDYIFWINEMHLKFRKMIWGGEYFFMGQNEEYNSNFTEWLCNEVKE